MNMVTVGSTRFHATDSGGDGPAVLLLHGNLMDASMWDGVVDRLAGYRCIRFDFRLHGDTADDGLPFTYWDAARDALDVLDALGVAAAHVVGHSQGGFTALRVALLAPDRVQSLALIDTAGNAFPGPSLQQMAQIRDGFATGEVAATAANVLELLLGTGRDELTHWSRRLRRQPAERLSAAVTVLMGADDITTRLGSITTPSVVIHGSADLPIPADSGGELVSALSGAGTLRLLDKVAHTPPVTHPAETAAILRGFLDGFGPLPQATSAAP